MTREEAITRLRLKRPLVFLDLESTVVEDGADPDPRSDRIVSLAVQKLYPDGKVTKFGALVNPGIPIAPASTEIHGITDDDVRDAPPFHVIGRPVAVGVDDSDLAGYYVKSYDSRLFKSECERHGITVWQQPPKIVDLYLLWAKMEPRDLAAFYRRVLGHDRPTTGHQAQADVADTVEAFLGAFETWPDLPDDVDGLADLCWRPNPVNIDPDGRIQWRGEVPTMCFSAKYRGWDMRRVPKDFWHWMLTKGAEGTSPAIKQLAADAERGVYPVRGQVALDLFDRAADA
jgi:DNA polymerase-3 subunit epsilon